jgi:putative DNA primase/helicase
MNLEQAIAATGMQPPARIVPGRWMRFPGIGKGKSNRAGWCRVITPTLAIFGDWSSNFTSTWRDEAHKDDANSARLLAQARAREAAFAAEQRARQAAAAQHARELVESCRTGTHCYLERKGFPQRRELIDAKKNLVIPMRDSRDYARIISAQLIAEDGDKKFLPGGRAKGAVFRIGAPAASRPVLCEGFATGLSIDAALKRLPGSHAVLVCFSAKNLERVAQDFRSAVVAADNDLTATGEEAAKRTGLKWTMPYEVGTDFNDLHRSMGLHVVVERMRELLRQ